MKAVDGVFFFFGTNCSNKQPFSDKTAHALTAGLWSPNELWECLQGSMVCALLRKKVFFLDHIANIITRGEVWILICSE